MPGQITGERTLMLLVRMTGFCPVLKHAGRVSRQVTLERKHVLPREMHAARFDLNWKLDSVS